jgi:DNA-directed RNA polymerase specialized sigma24 family protein
MRHADQLTFREAAIVLHITESAANLRYVRALRRLRKLWGRKRDRSVIGGIGNVL